MARVVHFELRAGDPDRASAFYRDVFGWEVVGFGGPVDYRLARTGDGPGIDGAITPEGPGQPTVVTVALDEPLEEALARAAAHGGEPLGEIGLIPGVGRHCYVRDTEGTIIGLLEPLGHEPSA